MDEGDRQRIRPRTDRLSSIEDLSGVGLIDPGQHFDQRRFARPVLSQERVDLSTTDVEVDVIERQRPGKALDEPGHREQRLRSAVRRDWSTGSKIDHPGFEFDRLGEAEIPGGSVPPGMQCGYLTPQMSR